MQHRDPANRFDGKPNWGSFLAILTLTPVVTVLAWLAGVRLGLWPAI